MPNYKPERDAPRQAEKSYNAARYPVAVRRSHWVDDIAIPRICAIHNEVSVWHSNRARPEGGQWACRSCGRLKSKGQRRTWRTEHTNPFLYNLKRSFAQVQWHSKKIGREFSITFADILRLWTAQDGKCAITGMPMEFLPGDIIRRRNKCTMDRIDSALGYTIGNVWLITDWANRAKSDLTRSELHLFAHGIIKGLPISPS